MGWESLPSAPEQEIDRLQMEAAARSETIGGFRSVFRNLIGDALQHSPEARERLAAVNAATDGQTDIRLAATPAGVLGYNRIGAGRAGMRLGRSMMATIRSEDEKAHIGQVVAHEAAHGDQVQLTGELQVNGESVSHEELYEGHAEISGNEAVGMGMTQHREGQPEALYAEGQNAAVTIIRRAGRAAFEQALTQDGDLDALQRKIDSSYALAS